MKLKPRDPENFYVALQAAGMPEVPREFSVLPQHQVIPGAILAEISNFILSFDRVTAREAWQAAALRDAPVIVQRKRPEVCFFSAWDFHLPPGGAWQLIEFNDNGSGFMFAAIINAVYYEAAGLAQEQRIVAPARLAAFSQHIGDLVAREARAFFGDCPAGLFLILDDAEPLQQGRFRKELQLLCDLLHRRGWQSELGCPAELRWDGQQLLLKGKAVSFIVNRSTDFFWQSEDFSALRTAYHAGRVYVAPNPFTYATRSDKRLLAWLSLSHWDKELGIEPRERQILNDHVPETHLIRTENVEALAQRKQEFVFKPLHGFAGRGLLHSAAVGRSRLRRLVTHSEGYVAQKRVPKPSMETDGVPLWTDLRVWAYRGEIFHLSGRASLRSDRLDLKPPGGWLPTYASL
ncbi:hypothetical protein PYH37_002010 [Sinorhizobium numidicum]|uniref:Circularly permuted type 2 ATP-grasp protein n=1 Tax=Sinorhizobium numidicum TaxID=680248 RepID=A0ABY8CU78_9HYPH|nr:hypothetical protein [Sinorhizobium numidicum]WEX74571.1 hypothetical protein PYH37_002010 [Sinorhizobium numidicum]WEX80561.1 hypothetical protein PYH38_002012 [Sinorhizobium numidicum]